MPIAATVARKRATVATAVTVPGDSRGASPLPPWGVPTFTTNSSGGFPCGKAIARAWELGCKTKAPLPGRNGCEVTAMSSDCEDPFELTRGRHNATKVTVRRVRILNGVRIGFAVDKV